MLWPRLRRAGSRIAVRGPPAPAPAPPPRVRRRVRPRGRRRRRSRRAIRRSSRPNTPFTIPLSSAGTCSVPCRPRYSPACRAERMIAMPGLNADSMAAAVPLTHMLPHRQRDVVHLDAELLERLSHLVGVRLVGTNRSANSRASGFARRIRRRPAASGPPGAMVTSIFSLGSTSPTWMAAGSSSRLLPGSAVRLPACHKRTSEVEMGCEMPSRPRPREPRLDPPSSPWTGRGVAVCSPRGALRRHPSRRILRV